MGNAVHSSSAMPAKTTPHSDRVASRERIWKFLVICATLAAAVLLLVGSNRQYSKGYELNPFFGSPPALWLGLGMMTTVAVSSILWGTTLVRKIGQAILVLSFLTFLHIPRIQGAFAYGRADQLGHFAFVEEISRNGHIGSDNFYPWAHINVAIIYEFTAAQLYQIAFLVSSFFSLFLAILFFLLATVYGLKDFARNFAFAASFIAFFGWSQFSILPNFFAYAFVPFVAFSLTKQLRTPDVRWVAISLPFILGVPFSHPFVSSALFIIFIIFAFLRFGQGQETTRRQFDMVLVVLLTWFLLNETMNSALLRLVNYFHGEFGISVADKATEKVERISLAPLEWFNMGVFFLGRFILITGMAIISVLRIKMAKRKDLRALYALALSMVTFQLILLLNPFVSHQPLRIVDINYAIPFFLIIACLGLELLAPRRRLRHGLGLALVASVLISWAGAIDSPLVYKPGQAVEPSDVQTARFFLSHWAENRDTFEPVGQLTTRFADIFYGFDKTGQRDYRLSLPVPDHFADGIWLNIQNHSYLWVSELSEQAYDSIYQRIGRFHGFEFEAIGNHPEWALICNNGELKIWRS